MVAICSKVHPPTGLYCKCYWFYLISLHLLTLSLSPRLMIPCNTGSTFCLGQMPGQCHPSCTHLSFTHTQLPKSVFNCLENGRLHPCNKGIRAIRKINGPGNDVKQIHHDWNSITYVHAHACAYTTVHTNNNTQMRLTQTTLAVFPFTQTKNSSPVHQRQKQYTLLLMLVSQLCLLLFSSRTESGCICCTKKNNLQHNM